MKILDIITLPQQDDRLAKVEFVCKTCCRPKTAVFLEALARSIASDPAGGDMYCFSCEPMSWRKSMAALAREDQTQPLVFVKLRWKR